MHTIVAMDTMVTLRVVDGGGTPAEQAHRRQAVERAAGWFREVERCCSRFEPESELRRLVSRPGVEIPASPMLFELTRFALALAEETDGAFDPTVGARMEARGFDRNYRTGESTRTAIGDDAAVSWRDVVLDTERRTITLRRPLLLDLGAVAKGFAIDMAARELVELEHFAVDAGGDLYVGGRNEQGEPWSVGIRHPRIDRLVIDTIELSDMAVCTSGDYERRSASADGSGKGSDHHILDPHTGAPARDIASATVIAPLAMIADGLATAAFVLGPARGIELLERHGVRGLLITPALERITTSQRDAGAPGNPPRSSSRNDPRGALKRA